jgi:hypothetical protein
MRALLAVRIATVSGFVKILTEVIAFGATADGMQVLAAIPPSARALAEARSKRDQPETAAAKSVTSTGAGTARQRQP